MGRATAESFCGAVDVVVGAAASVTYGRPVLAVSGSKGVAARTTAWLPSIPSGVVPDAAVASEPVCPSPSLVNQTLRVATTSSLAGGGLKELPRYYRRRG